MTRLGQAARITLKGFSREGIDHNSPLEDQCVLTYRAARRYAETNHFRKGTHRGFSGLTGPLVMKRIVESLFPEADKEHLEKLCGLINQVLKKTDAAVCVGHPEKRGDSPLWFVNDKMPDNIVIVALSHAKNKPAPLPHEPDWRDRQEARLTPEESGETLPPGKVEISFREPIDRETAFAETRDRAAAEHARLINDVAEFVAKSPVPVSVPEVHKLFRPEDELNQSTIRRALVEQGANGLLFSRIENDDERLLRGGGSFPKGKRLTLWSATDPVPVRSSLPDGIEPYRPATAWSADVSERNAEAMDSVLEVLGRSYPKGTPSRPRTPGRIAEVAGLPVDRVKTALRSLCELELVYESDSNKGAFYLADRKRGTYTHPDDEETPVLPPAPPAPPIHGDRAEMVREFMRLAHVLTAPSAPDNAELERLRAEVERLDTENTKLRSAVRSLKETVANLTDL